MFSICHAIFFLLTSPIVVYPAIFFFLPFLSRQTTRARKITETCNVTVRRTGWPRDRNNIRMKSRAFVQP